MGRLRNYFINHYPRTDFHELNQDWMISMLYNMIDQVENFVEMNAVKYADPIQWDITRQYEKNTIVVDAITGTAYISSKPVPMGVALSRTEYWSVIFDLGRFITLASQNFANSYEAVLTTTATMETDKDKWLVWNSILYRAKNDIHIGDRYVIDGNIEKYTVEMFFDELAHLIAEETEARIEADNVLHGEIVDESVARENADTALGGRIDTEIQNRQDADTALGIRIDTVLNGLENSVNLKFLDGRRMYVDCVNGDDDNDGFSEETPFRTMDRFFNVCNSSLHGCTDIRCYIISSGIYNVGEHLEHTINHITIHITGNVSGVVLNFLTEEDAKFYECHCNFNNITLRSQSIEYPNIYIDGGSYSITNCVFETPLQINSAQGVIRSSTLKRLSVYDSVTVLQTLTFTNTDVDVDCMYFTNSVIRLLGSYNQASLSGDSTSGAYIRAIGTFIQAGITIRNMAKNYYYGLYASLSYVQCPETQYNLFKSRCVYGDIPNGGSMFALVGDSDNNVLLGATRRKEQGASSTVVSVEPNSVTTTHITFSPPFLHTPNVIASIYSIGTPTTNGDDGFLSIIVSAIDVDGCNISISNCSPDKTIARRFIWCATDLNF